MTTLQKRKGTLQELMEVLYVKGNRKSLLKGNTEAFAKENTTLKNLHKSIKIKVKSMKTFPKPMNTYFMIVRHVLRAYAPGGHSAAIGGIERSSNQPG